MSAVLSELTSISATPPPSPGVATTLPTPGRGRAARGASDPSPLYGAATIPPVAITSGVTPSAAGRISGSSSHELHESHESRHFKIGMPKYIYNDVTMSDLARGTGYTLSMVSRVFNGSRGLSLPAARDFATYLGLSIEQVIAIIASYQQVWQ